MQKTFLAPLPVLGLAILLAACGSKTTALPANSPTPPPVASAPPVDATVPRLSADAVDAEMAKVWRAASAADPLPCDDLTFLRRAKLDLHGTIPTPEEIKAYEADTRPDKRKRLVEALAAAPGFADHMTNVWDRLLLGRDLRKNFVDRSAFRDFLRTSFNQKVPYDRFVRSIISATGENKSGSDRSNPAVNFYLRYADSLADLTGITSRVFLGVQIQCAQCHDHKTEKWKTADFLGLAASYAKTKADVVEEKQGGTKRLDVNDRPKLVARKKDGVDIGGVAPKALDGTNLEPKDSSKSRREALADWMISPSNPFFAKAIVNRVANDLLGRAFFTPVDDARDSRPPVAPALLDAIAKDFVRGGYDLRGLYILLAQTRAYQASSTVPTASVAKEETAAPWTVFPLQRLGPDELLASLSQATGIGRVAAGLKGVDPEALQMALRKQFAFVFDVDEEGDHSGEFDGTITQGLLLMNGRLIDDAVSVKGGNLDEVLKSSKDDRVRIRALYNLALGRAPDASETEAVLAFLQRPAPPATDPPKPAAPVAGKGALADPMLRFDDRLSRSGKKVQRSGPEQRFEDVFWALLNSSEFLFNH